MTDRQAVDIAPGGHSTAVSYEDMSAEELAARMHVWLPGDAARRGRELAEHGVPTNADLDRMGAALEASAAVAEPAEDDVRRYLELERTFLRAVAQRLKASRNEDGSYMYTDLAADIIAEQTFLRGSSVAADLGCAQRD